MIDLASLKSEPDRLVKKRHELQQQERELICAKYKVLLDEGRHLANLHNEIIDLQDCLQKASLQTERLVSGPSVKSKEENSIQHGEIVACLPAIANILSTPKRVQRLIDEDNLEEALRLAVSTRRSPQGRRVASKLDPLIQITTETLLKRLADSSLDQTVSIVRTVRNNVDQFSDLRYAFLKIRRQHLLGLKDDPLSFMFDTVAQYKAVFGNDYLLRSWLINVLQDCGGWSEYSDQTLSKLGVNVSPCFLQKRVDDIVMPVVGQDLAEIKQAFEDIKSFCPLSAYDAVLKHFTPVMNDEKAKLYVKSCMEKLFPREKLRKFLLLPQTE